MESLGGLLILVLTCLGRTVWLTVFAGVMIGLGGSVWGHLEAQEPDSLPVPLDSLFVDSLSVDSVAVDSLGVPILAAPVAPDSLLADSLAADTLPLPPIMPAIQRPRGAGEGVTSVWEWSREELTAVRGQTLAEILAEIPGVLPIRGGDFGSPTVAFPMGAGGGSIRIYWDGVEHFALEGSVPDLNRIPLVALESIRVERGLGGLEIHMERLVQSNSQPYSFIQAGTGDVDTNLLRGAFSSARALGGKLALGIERIDTQGRSNNNPGATTGGWLRYSIHRGNQGGLEFETRRMTSDRSDSLSFPASVKRSDWTVRGRWFLTDSLLVNAWATGAELAPKDSLAVLPFAKPERGQTGLALTTRRGALWARTTARFNRGEGVVDRELAVELQALSSKWGGVSGKFWSEGWDGESASGTHLKGWLTPVSGISLFASRSAGRRGVSFLLPRGLDTLSSTADTMSFREARNEPRFTDRSDLRIGAEVSWRGVQVSAARLQVEADTIWPIGLSFDRFGPGVPLAKRTGVEVMGRLPLIKGWGLEGGFQRWNAVDTVPMPYFPDHLYNVSVAFHDTFLPTENFELWVNIGAQGRSGMMVSRARASEDLGQEEAVDPMLVLEDVPFYQSWFFRIQARIVSVNFFIGFENLTARARNQDIPGHLLPGTRGVYGVRWTMWN